MKLITYSLSPFLNPLDTNYSKLGGTLFPELNLRFWDQISLFIQISFIILFTVRYIWVIIMSNSLTFESYFRQLDML